MATPTNAAEAPSATYGDTSSGEQVSHASEGSEREEGITRDEEAKVPEYERLRQENLRKNSLKLYELGVPLLAASLRESTTTKAGGGEGKTATKSTRSAGASSLENCPGDGGELVRRSSRLKQPPPKAGRSRKRGKKQKDALCKESKETVRSVKSSSDEWHNEEEKTESSDIENDDERGNGDDEVSPVGVQKPHRGTQKSQGRAPTTEPSVWEVHKRGPTGSGISKPRSTSLRPQQAVQPQQRKRFKMSEDSLSGEAFDYCNDVAAEIHPDQGGITPPSRGLPTAVPCHGSITSLDLEIAERHLQLLQWRRAMELQEPGVNSSTYSLSVISHYNSS